MRVGLLGAGTVGSALVDLLARHGPTLTDRLGEPIEVAAVVVRDAARPRRLTLPPGLAVTTDPSRVADDPSIAIVVEVMGGIEPARAYVLRALGRGASVVTANKALVAACGPELFAAARAGGGDLLFEAAVGAAVPVVGALERALAASRVRAIAGVLNGSTNYLLALMAEGVAFEAAVGRARALGYLEADPTDDVDGHDSARKIAILASIAAGRHHASEAVERRGLAGVGPGEVALAADLGAALKLLAVAERSDEDGEGDAPFALWVAPSLVPATAPLAAVHGAANAVAIAAEPGGETLLAGQGAGGPPTAQAVAGDVLTAARRRRAGQRGPLSGWAASPSAVRPRPMPAYAYAMRVLCAPADRGPLERAVAAARGVLQAWPHGSDAIALTTSHLRAGEAASLAQDLAHLPGAQAVGAPLVRWTGLDSSATDQPWWRAPALLRPAAVGAAATAERSRPT